MVTVVGCGDPENTTFGRIKTVTELECPKVDRSLAL